MKRALSMEVLLRDVGDVRGVHFDEWGNGWHVWLLCMKLQKKVVYIHKDCHHTEFWHTVAFISAGEGGIA